MLRSILISGEGKRSPPDVFYSPDFCRCSDNLGDAAESVAKRLFWGRKYDVADDDVTKKKARKKNRDSDHQRRVVRVVS